MKKPRTVNERIDEIMLDRGLTKQELAAKTGKNVVTIDRILAGTNTPSFSTVKSIADALDCPVDYLIKGVGSSEKTKGDPWENEAWAIAKSQLVKKDEQIEEKDGILKSFATSLDRLTKMMQDSGVSFLRPVAKTGT